MPRTSQKRDRRSISTFGRITSPAMLLGVMSARRCTTSGVTIADLRSGGDAVSIPGGGLSQVLPEGMATPL